MRDWLYATGWDGDDTPDAPIDPDNPNNPGDPGDDPNVPEEPVVPSYDGEITASSVNLRSEPSTSSSVVGASSTVNLMSSALA